MFKSLSATLSLSLMIAISMCSVPISCALKRTASRAAWSSTLRALGVYESGSATFTLLSCEMSCSKIATILSSSAPFSIRTSLATQSSCLNRPRRICSVPTEVCPSSLAASAASSKASSAFFVNPICIMYSSL